MKQRSHNLRVDPCNRFAPQRKRLREPPPDPAIAPTLVPPRYDVRCEAARPGAGERRGVFEQIYRDSMVGDPRADGDADRGDLALATLVEHLAQLMLSVVNDVLSFLDVSLEI